jgi:hypothetical protein
MGKEHNQNLQIRFTKNMANMKMANARVINPTARPVRPTWFSRLWRLKGCLWTLAKVIIAFVVIVLILRYWDNIVGVFKGAKDEVAAHVEKSAEEKEADRLKAAAEVRKLKLEEIKQEAELEAAAAVAKEKALNAARESEKKNAELEKAARFAKMEAKLKEEKIREDAAGGHNHSGSAPRTGALVRGGQTNVTHQQPGAAPIMAQGQNVPGQIAATDGWYEIMVDGHKVVNRWKAGDLIETHEEVARNIRARRAAKAQAQTNTRPWAGYQTNPVGTGGYPPRRPAGY